MYCVNHEYEEAVFKCSSCGVDICARCNIAADGKPAMCADCQEERMAKRKRWRIPQLILIVAGFWLLLGPFGLQVIGNKEKPDTTSIDYVANECIDVLDDIGLMLADGNLPPDSLRCANQFESFVVEQNGDEIRVSHPDPESLGYLQMYVTNKDPAPVTVMPE